MICFLMKFVSFVYINIFINNLSKYFQLLFFHISGADGSNNCWTINYVSRRICALKGSSVNISSKYSHPEYLQPQTKHWYKVKMNTKQEEEQLMDDGDDIKNKHILRLTNLDQKDSGEYKLRIKADNELIQSDYHGVTLIVTELQVDLRPAAEVTEGQRVTLTCSTSCPLRENTIYIWYLNSLSLSKAQNKQLIIDAVSMQDGGNYSCAVGTIRSAGKTLIVQRRKANWKPAAAGISAVLVILAPLCIFLYR
uniref:Ig-like domain-containing protein n=1 Tax=Cyprinodon variegatus TaxID=28743 RepID=A0A3Q2DSN9_CYPVA